ncbi:MAG: TrbC/VirB2 family protein [Alphaproteobacteria bacterium]
MKSLLKYAAFAMMAGVLLFGFDALAQNNNAFSHAANLLQTTFKNVRMIVYIVGAFGLIAIAIGGILGKIAFSKLAYLAIGLAIVAGADAIVRYAIQNTAQDQSAGIGYDKYELK